MKERSLGFRDLGFGFLDSQALLRLVVGVL
jgi:hypothetical protein